MKKIQKILFGIFLLVFVLFGAAVWQNRGATSVPYSVLGAKTKAEQSANSTSENLLHVYFLDVGQGDAEFIRTPDGENILIDGGPDNKVLDSLGKVMPFYDRQIDVMILTHPHADHVTGLVEVLRRYDVKSVYYTAVLQTTPDYLTWLKEINDRKIPLFIVKKPFDLQLGDVTLKFLYPTRDLTNARVSNLNNSSIVNELIYKNEKFLFTGDLEQEGEKELLAAYQPTPSVESMKSNNNATAPPLNNILSAEVLKVGHHGSNTASSEELLKAVEPKIAVIEVGQDNKFGHPHLITLKRLERFNAEILRTDLMGTIKFDSDGEKVWQEK
ncbi:MAG: ComEC/Rec2 family competence protein [Parcubacteria group bacterium]